MKLATIVIAKIMVSVGFIVWVLISPSISDWWTILGIALLFSDTKSINL